jgi:hypothetical protein
VHSIMSQDTTTIALVGRWGRGQPPHTTTQTQEELHGTLYAMQLLLITSYTRDTHTLNDQLHQCIALPEAMHYEATRPCKTKGRRFETLQKERG